MSDTNQNNSSTTTSWVLWTYRKMLLSKKVTTGKIILIIFMGKVYSHFIAKINVLILITVIFRANWIVSISKICYLYKG
jgi:hypothetical protein